MIKCFRTRLLMLTFGFRNKWGIMERWREWRIFHQSRKPSYMDARLNLTDFVFLSTHIWEKTAVMSPFSRVPYTQPLPLDPYVFFRRSTKRRLQVIAESHYPSWTVWSKWSKNWFLWPVKIKPWLRVKHRWKLRKNLMMYHLLVWKKQPFFWNQWNPYGNVAYLVVTTIAHLEWLFLTKHQMSLLPLGSPEIFRIVTDLASYATLMPQDSHEIAPSKRCISSTETGKVS